MFFYYQVRTHHHKTENVLQTACPLCHATGHLYMSIMQKYMWVLGPVAPSAKYAVAFCEHCNNYIPKVKWTNEMDSVYRNLKKDVKTPRRLYRGLIVFPLAIAVLIGAILLFAKVDRHKQDNNQALIKEAIAHPRKGDIFQITHTDGTHVNYTYFKVARVEGDSIYVNESNIYITDPKKMKEWDEIPTNNNAYGTAQVGFSISQAQAADMFTYATQPVRYGIVWSLYRDGQLYKKY
jgi:hypothetical protein